MIDIDIMIKISMLILIFMNNGGTFSIYSLIINNLNLTDNAI